MQTKRPVCRSFALALVGRREPCETPPGRLVGQDLKPAGAMDAHRPHRFYKTSLSFLDMLVS